MARRTVAQLAALAAATGVVAGLVGSPLIDGDVLTLDPPKGDYQSFANWSWARDHAAGERRFAAEARLPYLDVAVVHERCPGARCDGMHMNKIVFKGGPCPKNAALLDHAILDLWLGASGVLDRLAPDLAPADPDRRAFAAVPGARPSRTCWGRAGNENVACADAATEVPPAAMRRYFGGSRGRPHRADLGPEKDLGGYCCKDCY